MVSQVQQTPKQANLIEQFAPLLIASFVLAIAVMLGWMTAKMGNMIPQLALLGLGGLVLVTLILLKPHWGLIAVLASLPIQAQYAEIPFLNSVLSLIGLLTIAGYLLQSRLYIRMSAGFRPQYYLALAFLIWITISNPQAALSTSPRNWFLTYFQLLIMVWLAAELLTPAQHRLLMILYIIPACLSAAIAIPQAEVTDSIYTSTRSAGLVGNENELAMYLVFAIIFAIHLYRQHVGGWLRIVWLPITVLLILGVVVSISRTGFIALAACLLMIIALPLFYARFRAPLTAQGRARRNQTWIVTGIGLIAIVSAALMVIPQGYWQLLSESFQKAESDPSLNSWNDTSVVRYALWQSAFRMWQDHPIAGVGVGESVAFNDRYLDTAYLSYANKVAHNMYLTILAENGVIGAALFGLWLLSIMVDLWLVIRRTKDREIAALAATWMIVLVVSCIMGATNSFQYYKPLWIAAGVSMALRVASKDSARSSKAVTSANASAKSLAYYN